MVQPLKPQTKKKDTPEVKSFFVRKVVNLYNTKNKYMFIKQNNMLLLHNVRFLVCTGVT